MGLYSFIGVAVTSAAFVIYPNLPPEQKKNLWDPVFLLSLFRTTRQCCGRDGARWRWPRWRRTSPPTWSARPTISPILWPRRISFRIGGFITGVIGILIQPWRLLANAGVYIDKWLVGYSSLAGRGRRRADCRLFCHSPHAARSGRPVPERSGPYWYTGGFNLLAVIALLAGIGLCVPGFLAAVGFVALQSDATAGAELHRIPAFWGDLYSYAWFTSFGTAFVLYIVLMLCCGPRDKTAC